MSCFVIGGKRNFLVRGIVNMKRYFDNDVDVHVFRFNIREEKSVSMFFLTQKQTRNSETTL